MERLSPLLEHVRFQFPLRLETRQITLIVDARNYDESGDRLIGVLAFFKADRCADLWSSFSEIQSIFPPHDPDLNPTHTVSEKNTHRVAATPIPCPFRPS